MDISELKGGWSLIQYIPNIYFFTPFIFEVYSGAFYMGAMGGPTPKRHRLWSNDRALLDGIVDAAGYLSAAARAALPGDSLVRIYYDHKGNRRHAGIPGRLRNSQPPGCYIYIYIVPLYGARI